MSLRVGQVWDYEVNWCMCGYVCASFVCNTFLAVRYSYYIMMLMLDVYILLSLLLFCLYSEHGL